MLFTFRYFKLVVLLSCLFSLGITAQAQTTIFTYQVCLAENATPANGTFNFQSGFRALASNGPAAANVYMMGQVVTSEGEAIDGASVTLLDTFTNVSRTVTSTEKGKFFFDNLKVTHFYIVSVKSKQYVFASDSYSFEMTGNFKSVKFTGVLQE